MTWRFWTARKRRGGAHRGPRTSDVPAPAEPLQRELEAARRRLAEVELRAPAVERSDRRATEWLKHNHIGPLFDQAFGAGK